MATGPLGSMAYAALPPNICGKTIYLSGCAEFRYLQQGRLLEDETRCLEQFIIYAQSHSGVTFMRKDEIALFTLEPLTLREGI